MSDFLTIQKTPEEKCELCGKKAETRPYGPKGEKVCFDCGMKDQQACREGFKKLVLGVGRIIGRA